MKKILEKFKDKKILVIGDVMLDQYSFGYVSGISPEAPVPVVKIYDDLFTPGGASNTTNNISSLGGIAYIAGIVGDDEERNTLKEKLKENNVIPDGLFIDENRPTTKKQRIIAQSQQVVRLDYEKREGCNEKTEKNLIDYTKNIIDQTDVVVISDYAKGAITENLASYVINLCKEKRKPIIVDPKPQNINFYKEATLVTPNQKEASSITKIENKLENVVLMGEQLKKMLNSNVLITQGKHGASLIKLNGNTTYIPTKAKEVYDVSGAGDTVVATLALAIAAGANLEDAVVLANYAAGIVVGKTGTETTTIEEIKSFLEKDSKKTLDETTQ